MKTILCTICILAFSATASAEDYSCFAKANPERGFASEFRVKVINGQAALVSEDYSSPLGEVSELLTMDSTDAEMAPAFAATLGLIAEEDVSAIKADDLAAVTKIQVLKVGPSPSDIYIYKLYSGDTQVGGSFYISGMATSCIPNN